MHPSVSQILKFFEYSHLPKALQDVSLPFGVLASSVANRAPDNPETTVALRKLLEAKDAAVRAVIPERKDLESGETVAEAAKRGFTS